MALKIKVPVGYLVTLVGLAIFIIGFVIYGIMYICGCGHIFRKWLEDDDFSKSEHKSAIIDIVSFLIQLDALSFGPPINPHEPFQIPPPGQNHPQSFQNPINQCPPVYNSSQNPPNRQGYKCDSEVQQLEDQLNQIPQNSELCKTYPAVQQ